jgi:hypothetical protein
VASTKAIIIIATWNTLSAFKRISRLKERIGTI